MARHVCRNQHIINNDNAIGMLPPADQELANTPTMPRDDTTMDLPNPSSDGPRCEYPENFKVHFKGIKNELSNVEFCFEKLENEFKIFSSEFSNFHMENTMTNIQTDLENIQNAQFLLNETLTLYA